MNSAVFLKGLTRLHCAMSAVSGLRHLALISLSVLAICGGCRGRRVQSSLHAEGPPARAIADLWWIMLVVLGCYTLAVFALAAYGVFRSPQHTNSGEAAKRPSFFRSTRLVVVGGIVLPTLILVPLLIYSTSATAALRHQPANLTIRVTGHRWWWEVQYPDLQFETANQLVIPAGQPVLLELATEDVIHSFWVPQLHGKTDMLPGRISTSWLLAEQPGVYRGQCAEYCGGQHAHMAFEVIALPQPQFVDWWNHGGGELPTLEDEGAQSHESSGLSAFFRHGCAACHAIAGTAAVGEVGPELSDLGDRRMLAAATLPNNRENLFEWLQNPQAIKPGVKMPATAASEAELWTIVDYLLQLKSGRVNRLGGRADSETRP